MGGAVIGGARLARLGGAQKIARISPIKNIAPKILIRIIGNGITATRPPLKAIIKVSDVTAWPS
jgi:hypothetical protein